MADGIDAIKIGDVIIDEETGEILAMPEGLGDPLEWLTHKAKEANEASKAWAAQKGMYHAAIGRLLAEAGVKAMKTSHGTPMHMTRTDRRASGDAVHRAIAEHELSPMQQRAIFLCAASYNVKELEALRTGDGDNVRAVTVPDEVIDGMIETSVSAWVQVRPPTPNPPPAERVSVTIS
jgi:hypothetical protein